MKVTLTLSSGSLPGLDLALTGLGLEVRHRPLLRFADRLAPQSSAALLPVAGRPGFGAIAVTSPRAATLLGAAVSSLSSSETADLPDVWVAGPRTRSVLPGSLVCRLPVSRTGATALVEAMIAAGVRGPVLYVCSVDRRDELPDRLRSSGIEVTEWHAYDVELAGPSVVREALLGTDLILIASHRILRVAVAETLPVERPGLISLGPATANTARQLGWRPVAVSADPSVAGVVDAIHSLFFAVPGPQSSPSNPSSGR